MKIEINLPLIAFIILVALKLAGIVDWSWWIITIPLWAPLILGIAFLIVWNIVLKIFGKGMPTHKW